jgi:hypothetical protein
MNELTLEVQETFNERAATVAVPPFDEVAFRRRVRGNRRRRRGAVAATAAVAASVVALSAYAVEGLTGAGGDPEPRVATQPAVGEAVERLRPSELVTRPLYYTAEGRLAALTPDGTVHDLGLRSEAVVGSTEEGVLALDDDGGVVWFDAVRSGGDEGAFSFRRGQSPVTGPVSSVALSSDGRWLAWLGPDGVVTVYDREARTRRLSLLARPNSYVSAVDDRGVLVSEDGDLRLYETDGVVEVPTAQGGYGWQSDVAGDRVSVMDRDGVTRVYDVASGEARLLAEVPGAGRLAPSGSAVVTAGHEDGEVRLWSQGEVTWLSGQVAGVPEAVGWLDERHLVLTSRVGDGTVVQVCALADRVCDEVLTSEEDVRLPE